MVGSNDSERVSKYSAIITAAELTGAEAIHPGYGFSENSRFVRILEDCNITFIGPKAEHIEIMGDKIKARKLFPKQVSLSSRIERKNY